MTDNGMHRARGLLVRALRMELGGWASLFRFLLRRPRVPAGAVGFGYDKPIRPILLAILAVSAIEVPVVDLIVHRWPAVRWPLLVLGIWGITFMLGMLCAFITRPHAVGPTGIRVRHGAEIDIPLTWDDIASVARRRTAHPDAKTTTLSEDPRGTVLAVQVQDATDIEIELERPTPVRIPSGTVEVSVVRLSVDDPRGFLDAVRTHLQPA